MKRSDLKNKNMALLLREYPRLGEILAEKGIDCASCLASQVDTLPDVARMYKLDLEQLLQNMEPGAVDDRS
ncbi:MAG: DUF1858 domain-containing protein [Magnetococcales bacterium]|nr:DUF1858 domain-containing protein [Magnetococcales bacterium]